MTEQTMTVSVRELLQTGNHYAANHQWNNAAGAYRHALAALCASVTPDKPLEPVPELVKALRALGDDASHEPLEGAALRALRRALAEAHKLQLAPFMSAIQTASINRWIIVYHDEKALEPACELKSLPCGASRAFLVDMVDKTDEVRSAPVSDAKCAQLAYTLSHLAWANVTIAQRLYTVNRVLDRQGAGPIKREARKYIQSLRVRPDASWTLAHLGEAYRNIANGWPASEISESAANGRVNDYVTAMVCYEEAIRLNPNDFWAHAHLGAAIVNVRAFLGVEKPTRSLQALLDRWSPGRTLEQQNEELLDKAMASLRKAMALQGNFYPWAQLYAADVLLIMSVIVTDDPKKRAMAHEAGALATTATLNGMVLQPQLAGQLVEPGVLYDNAFYQVALVSLWTKLYMKAWQYARIGQSRNFKFDFIPGLQSLCGYQILVSISAGRILDPNPEEGEYLLPYLLLPADTSDTPVPIPSAPIDKRDRLVAFIGDVITKVAIPVASPYLRADTPINTTIRISLLQVVFILGAFARTLKDLAAKSNPPPAVDECIGVANEVMDTLDLEFAGSAERDASISTTYAVGDMSTVVFTGNLSYSMATQVQPKKKPPVP